MLATGGRCTLLSSLGAPGHGVYGRSLANISMHAVIGCRKKSHFFTTRDKEDIRLAVPADRIHDRHAIGMKAALHVAVQSLYAEA